MSGRIDRAKLYYTKWRWFERNHLPWNRLALHREFMAREAYMRWPLEGNVLQALRRGAMEMGPGVHLEPHVWISILEHGHLVLGEGVALNHGVFISVHERVEIGAHSGVGNGSFISDGMRNFPGPASGRPFMRSGLWGKGPTIIGSNVWVSVNCTIASGVTVGDWTLIGANSVVTSDIPAGVVAAGAPARVIRDFDFAKDLRPGQAERASSA